LMTGRFTFNAWQATPQYNIKDVIKSAGKEEYRQLYDELVHIRKLYLVYRLLHFDDAFKDVKLNIRNRERELTASIIRLFKGTKALEVVLPVLSDFLSEKREKKALSLEAKLYNVVKRLVLQHGHVLDNETIFEECKVALDLQPIQGTDYSFYSNVLEDVVSLKQMSRVLLDKFGAKAKKGNARSKVFDPEKLQSIASTYDIPEKIEIIDEDTSPTHPTHPTLVGSERSPSEEHQDSKVEKINNKAGCSVSNPIENSIDITTFDQKEQGRASLQASKVSKASPYDKLIQKGCQFYYCTLHPSIKNVYKETIEHHCQYAEPEKHLEALHKLEVG
jgi:hypothetical protein